GSRRRGPARARPTPTRAARRPPVPGRRPAPGGRAPRAGPSLAPLPVVPPVRLVPPVHLVQPGPDRLIVLAEEGRRTVLARRRPVEPQRRPRQLDPPELRVVDLDDEALRAGLLPLVHLVDRPDGPGGEKLWPEWWDGLEPFGASAAAIARHLVDEGYLESDGGMLFIGPEAEKRFGRIHFRDLTAVFTAAPQFTVVNGRTEVGRVDPMLLTESVTGPRLLLLG